MKSNNLSSSKKATVDTLTIERIGNYDKGITFLFLEYMIDLKNESVDIFMSNITLMAM